MTCKCMTCRIASIAFGEDLNDVQPQQAADGIQALTHVLAVGLSFAEDDALEMVVDAIKDARSKVRENAMMLKSHHGAGHA